MIAVSNTSLYKGQIDSKRIVCFKTFDQTAFLHDVCAFANDIDNQNGGFILLEDMQEENLDELCGKIWQILQCIQPRYTTKVTPIFYEGKPSLFIWAKAGRGRPYQVPLDFLEPDKKGYFIRKSGQSVLASRKDLIELQHVCERISWDSCPNRAAKSSDLDLGLLEDFLQKTNSPLQNVFDKQTLLQTAYNLQLFSEWPQETPIHASLLFFSQNPQHFYCQAYIEIIHLKADGNFAETRCFGPVPAQIKQAANYMQNMLVKEKVLKEANTPYAKRIWNYPPEIITELLVQAIWHHAYWKNQPVRILLAFNSIQITISTDLADTDFKEETFWKRCRNPRIGELFTWLGLLDESQIEFASIKQAVKENGSAHMEFFYDGQNNRLSVLVPMHPCFVKKSTLKEEAYQKKILAILETQPLTLTRLSAAMGYKSITSKLRQSVNLLLEQGRVVYVRSKKREKRLGLDKTR